MSTSNVTPVRADGRIPTVRANRSNRNPRSVKLPKEKKIRVTIIVQEMLDRNLEAYAACTGASKTKIVTEALRDFVIGKGLDPSKPPRMITR